MSSLKWRREQPRANQPSVRVWWWLDIYVSINAAAVYGAYAWMFIADGALYGLVGALLGGFIFARFYPFEGIAR